MKLKNICEIHFGPFALIKRSNNFHFNAIYRLENKEPVYADNRIYIGI